MSDNSAGLLGDALQYALAGGAGVAGRIMYHLHLIQRGECKPWWCMLADMAIALIVGWTVLGLGEWFGVPFKAVQSLSIIAGWSGPQIFNRIIEAGLTKWGGEMPQPKDDKADETQG